MYLERERFLSRYFNHYYYFNKWIYCTIWAILSDPHPSPSLQYTAINKKNYFVTI